MKTLIGLAFLLALFPQDSVAFRCSDSVSVGRDAQLYAGVHSLSGGMSISYSSLSKTGETITTIAASPTYLYFTSPNFAIGGQFLFLWVMNSNATIRTTRSNYGVGPIVRYYFLRDEVLAFVAASIFIQESEISSEAFSFSSGHSSSGSVGLGVDIFVSRSWSLEPNVQYQFSIGGASSFRTFLAGISIATFIN